MVKVTGRTRDPAHLAAHLTYITRNGDLPAEVRDGVTVEGRREVIELAQDWSAAAMMDSRRRANSPSSVAIILSMPAETDAIRLRDAARAFAVAEFEERFDYLLVLHTDQAHPHVHLTVRALGERGERLNPKKADLERWRQTFAEALRERGVDAEATPRRARGVTRKPERAAVRRIRDRHVAGQCGMGRVAAEKLKSAAQVAFGRVPQLTAWEERTVRRQQAVRRIYLAQAKLLQTSADPDDRRLAHDIEGFVRGMPQADSERLALARELRAVNDRAPAAPRPTAAKRERGR
ncbi:MAG: relaxase/mobilization nuclease domain-containing protein [Pseudomonadota bacterium]